MRITYIHRAGGLLMALIASAGCGSQPAPPAANPIADELRAQAHQLAQESDACRKDAAAYRNSHPGVRQCGSGVVTIGLGHRAPAETCGAAILAALPSCIQWDDSYRIMAGADRSNAAATPPAVKLMESKEADPAEGLAADDRAADESRAGD
jgi:hypothetical protein